MAMLLAMLASVGAARAQKPAGDAPAQNTPGDVLATPAAAPKLDVIPAEKGDAVPDKGDAVPGRSQGETGAAGAAADAFVLGPEDVIYIRVMHEPDLTGPQDVRPDGMIVMQLIGEIKAAGKTPAQLAADIRSKLLATMRSPEVTVQLTKVNSRKFTIQGEVNRPGTYTFSTPVTVLEALVNGQGFRDFANVKKIYILRKGERLRFNYKDVSHGKHMDENVTVQNGDQIFVP